MALAVAWVVVACCKARVFKVMSRVGSMVCA